MTYKVFISHSSIDTWVARQIAKHIVDVEADYFLDARDIQRGDDFEDVIRNAIHTCQECIVLLTPWSIESRYVFTEAAAFWAFGKRVVYVLYNISVNQLNADPQMPMYLKRVNNVLINDLDTYFVELKARVAKGSSDDL